MVSLPIPGLNELLSGMLHLLYPNLCVGCDADLPGSYSCFCIRCQNRLEPTEMHLQAENEFTNRFWGRLPLESGTSMYYFNRKSPIQRALHQLKYKNQPEIGLRIGRRFGLLLAQSPYYKGVQGVVPVPLHPKKELLRGYNQSTMLAQGIAEALHIPVWPDALRRNTFSVSQTRKKRMDRFENVSDVFAVKQPVRVSGQHLLLVDDVLTTGATLESCGRALLDLPGTRLSMATIAIAMK